MRRLCILNMLQIQIGNLQLPDFFIRGFACLYVALGLVFSGILETKTINTKNINSKVIKLQIKTAEK